MIRTAPDRSVEFHLDQEVFTSPGFLSIRVERVTLGGTFIGWIIERHGVSKLAGRWIAAAPSTLRLGSPMSHLDCAYLLVAHHERREEKAA